jgi:hypothetical protein
VSVTEAPPNAETEPSGSPPRPPGSRPARRVQLLAALPVVILILIPVVIFAGAALVTGHPLLIGDNLIQSYPLRVLVGTDFRQGTLPLWDPWIWSGTPLMAGLNAGAFYPTTFLFAVMPPTGAWVLTQIVASASVSVGTYVFLRETGIGRMPSFLGAVSFAFAGAVAAQGAVHMDMAEGFASLPWMLLAVRHVVEDGRWRWSLLLGVAVACLILAGAPEAILDVSILSVTYAIVRLSLLPSAWARLLTRAGAGFAMGVGLAAFLWLPALKFIATSQRGGVSPTFAASYSFPGRALVLGIAPFLEGGWGLLSEPHYLGLSNLPEVAFYVGLLPVVAVVALIGRRWGNWLPHGERRTWYAVGLVGLALAVGAKTPLEHVIWHIPYYGKQRDQGRNIVDVDFAACVLFAWWLDGGGRPKGARAASEAVAATFVAAAAAGLLAWLLAAPASLWRALHAVAPSPAQLGSMRTATAVAVALAVVAAVLVLVRHRLPPAPWLRLAAVFVVVDVALFASGTSVAATQGVPTSSHPGALLQIVKDNLSPGGRYAVFDPDLFYPSSVVQMGEANIGILAGLPSVQGYGAALGAQYSLRTATHIRGFLAVGELQEGFFQPLSLQVMLAPAEEFLTPIAALPEPGSVPDLASITEGSGVDPLLPGGNVLPPEEDLIKVNNSGPRPSISDGGRAGWFFGTIASPTAATLLLSRDTAGQLVRLGEIGSSGTISWQSPQRLAAGATVAPLSVRAAPSAGLVVQLLSGSSLGPLRLAVRADGRSYEVNGPLVNAVTPASWGYVGSAEHFAAFRADYTPEPAWVQPLGTYAIAAHLPADVTVLSQSTDGVTIAVRTPRASILLRSSAWDAGWHAEIVSGPTATALLQTRGALAQASLPAAASTRVLQVGLVQAVDIPAGLSVVRFSYAAPGFSKGLLISAGTLAAVLLATIAAFLLRRRRQLPPALDPFGRP